MEPSQAKTAPVAKSATRIAEVVDSPARFARPTISEIEVPVKLTEADKSTVPPYNNTPPLVKDVEPEIFKMPGMSIPGALVIEADELIADKPAKVFFATDSIAPEDSSDVLPDKVECLPIDERVDVEERSVKAEALRRPIPDKVLVADASSVP